MNLEEFFIRLGHILGILGGGNDTTTTTALTTSGDFMRSSTPMIIDTSSLSQYRTTENPHLMSTKFLSSLSTGTPYETSTDDHQMVKSSTPETNSSSSTEFSVTTGKSTHEVSTSSGAPDNGTDTSPSGSTETTHTGSTETTHTGSTETSHTGSTETTHTGSTETTHTGSTETTHTGSTGTESTHTGSTGTGSTPTPVTPTGSDPPPTDKPGLSRGAVAGIVIGCLLIVAIVTAAIVFVVKNRNGPESHRLNV